MKYFKYIGHQRLRDNDTYFRVNDDGTWDYYDTMKDPVFANHPRYNCWVKTNEKSAMPSLQAPKEATISPRPEKAMNVREKIRRVKGRLPL